MDFSPLVIPGYSPLFANLVWVKERSTFRLVRAPEEEGEPQVAPLRGIIRLNTVRIPTPEEVVRHVVAFAQGTVKKKGDTFYDASLARKKMYQLMEEQNLGARLAHKERGLLRELESHVPPTQRSFGLYLCAKGTLVSDEERGELQRGGSQQYFFMEETLFQCRPYWNVALEVPKKANRRPRAIHDLPEFPLAQQFLSTPSFSQVGHDFLESAGSISIDGCIDLSGKELHDRAYATLCTWRYRNASRPVLNPGERYLQHKRGHHRSSHKSRISRWPPLNED